MDTQDAPRIAVVGGGIAGMGAAHALLKAGARVAIFDREHQLGGDAFCVDLHAWDGGVHAVDGGVSDYNRATFVAFERFLEELGVERRPISRETGFHAADQRPVFFAADDGKLTFWQETPEAEALAAEHQRFRREAAAALSDPALSGASLGEFLRRGGYSPAFSRLCVEPRARGCFAMHDGPVLDFPLRFLAAFWRMHAIVGDAPPQRTCIVGGMTSYCRRFAKLFQDDGGLLRLGSDVFALRRGERGVEVRWMGDAGPARETFDHVVAAVKPSDLLPLVERATPAEARKLAAVPFRRDHVVVHTDERLLPRSKRAWGAFNLTIAPESGRAPSHPTITFWQNRLADLDSRLTDVFVTLNPAREPARDRVVASRYVVHPVGAGGALWGEDEWADIQGAGGLWFCGSFMEAPFLHENALRSGLRAAQGVLERLSRDGRMHRAG